MSKKVLMLHGYAQSASIFSAKTGGLRKSLAKAGYETIYVNAPMRLQSDQLHNPESESELYGWWQYGAPDYTVDDALETIQKAIEGQEIEGIIGFSQGAGLGGYIVAQYKKLIPSLKFGVFFSGFKLMPQRFEAAYVDKIELPSLHVIGELDTVVEEGRSLALWDVAQEDKRTMLKHHGGHFVPNSKDYVSKVLNWIAAVTAEQEVKKAEVDDDDIFAAIDNMGKA